MTGTDPSVANAPINKYFCNLMNALGVRAGEDGFPQVGGAGAVTHFGRYDKTQDFIGAPSWILRNALLAAMPAPTLRATP